MSVTYPPTAPALAAAPSALAAAPTTIASGHPSGGAGADSWTQNTGTRDLFPVEARSRFAAPICATVIVGCIASAIIHAPAGVFAIALLIWTIVLLRDQIADLFREPVARLGRAHPELSHDVAVEFTLSPKTTATRRSSG